jgi:hypothetical protein
VAAATAWLGLPRSHAVAGQTDVLPSEQGHVALKIVGNRCAPRVQVADGTVDARSRDLPAAKSYRFTVWFSEGKFQSIVHSKCDGPA